MSGIPEVSIVMHLKVARLRAGINQTELATRSGISAKVISHLETGRNRNVTLAQAVAFARAFGMTIDDFLSITPTADEAIEIGAHYTLREPQPKAARPEPAPARRVYPLAPFRASDVSPYPSLRSSLGGVV